MESLDLVVESNNLKKEEILYMYIYIKIFNIMRLQIKVIDLSILLKKQFFMVEPIFRIGKNFSENLKRN